MTYKLYIVNELLCSSVKLGQLRATNEKCSGLTGPTGPLLKVVRLTRTTWAILKKWSG